MTELALHDRRLEGTMFRRANVEYVFTDDSEPLHRLARRIQARLTVPERGLMRAATRPTPVRHLRIYAHGGRPQGSPTPGDGRVVLLSRDNLTRDNAESFGRALRWLVQERIWLYACAAAAAPDGEALCLNLARGANVPVVASRAVQDYGQHGRVATWAGVELGGCANWINFGSWEGEVVVCRPDGTVASWFVGPDATTGRDQAL